MIRRPEAQAADDGRDPAAGVPRTPGSEVQTISEVIAVRCFRSTGPRSLLGFLKSMLWVYRGSVTLRATFIGFGSQHSSLSFRNLSLPTCKMEAMILTS